MKSRIPLLLAAACIGALALSAASAYAFGNPNDAQCHGHIGQGAPEPGNTDTQVAYVFGCNVADHRLPDPGRPGDRELRHRDARDRR